LFTAKKARVVMIKEALNKLISVGSDQFKLKAAGLARAARIS
jgi:hypothetical protein